MSTCSHSTSNGILSFIDENNLFSIITSTTFLIIGTFLYIVSLYKYFEKKEIPNVGQPLAPYGSIGDVINKELTLYELLSKYYRKLIKKDYKYGGMYIFFKPTIFTVDLPLVNEILLNDKIFSDVSNHVNKHSELFSFEIVEEYLQNNENIRTNLIENITQDSIKFSSFLHNFIVDSVLMIFGLEKNDVTLNLLAESERKFTHSTLRYYFYVACPFFQQINDEKWKDIIQSNILKRKKEDIRKRDILQRLIDKIPGSDDDVLMKAFVRNLIQSLIYSYYSSLLCLYEICMSTEIQEALIGEIRRFNSSGRSLNDLPYLIAVVKECLRKYPPVPVVIKRCEDEFISNVDSLKISKGNLVIIPAYAIHHASNFYLNPDNFDPDRFLEDDIEHSGPFLPFGEVYVEDKDKDNQISINLIKVILFSIFSKCQVKLRAEDYYLSFDTSKLNIQPARPLPLQFDLLR